MVQAGNLSGKAAIAAAQHKKEGEYWFNKFSGNWQKSFFPYDHSKSIPGQQKSDSVKFEFPPGAVSTLMELSNGLDHRLYIILTACLVALLYKYTGNRDIIIGSPIFKQEKEGNFVNITLALRNQVHPHMSFKQLLLDHVKETIVEASRHQNYPIETLLSKLNIPFTDREFPLFDVVILLENIHEKKYSRHTYPNMIFSFLRTQKAIAGNVEYNTLLYGKNTIQRILGHFQTLVDNVISNVDIKISRVDILSEAEKTQLLMDFNNTRATYPAEKSIHELFEEQVVKNPNNTAVTYEGQPIAYNRLNQESDGLAAYLGVIGVKPEEPVALMAENSYKVIVAVLGILKAGGAYVPLNVEYPPERKKLIRSDCFTRVLLTNCQETDADDDDIKTTVIDLDNSHIYQTPVPKDFNRDKHRGSGSLAYIMYTSGSTGTPKGVMVEHRNVVRLVKNTNFIEFEQSDSILLTGALEFDASTFEIWGALLNGLTLHLVNKYTILSDDKLKQALARSGTTVMWMTSPLFNQMLDADIEIFNGLKALLVGGDVLSPSHINRLRNRFPSLKVINGYGPTENTTFSTTFPVDKEYQENIPIGSPINNSTAYIFDSVYQLVPIGVSGELYVGGDGISRGYLNNPELTAQKFLILNKAGYYRSYKSYRSYILYKTGDLARWLPEGNIDFLGRIDQQVKIRGYRVEPGEIENRLMQVHSIREAVVIIKKGCDSENYLCAYVVPTKEKKALLDTMELKKIISRQLPEYMVPAFLFQLNEMPLTPNGKIDRKALPEPGLELTGELIAPRNQVEDKMAAIWSRVLNIEKNNISIDSDFFDLGGYSLKATILIAKLHKAFDTRIPLAEFFTRPTIRELASYINQLKVDRFFSIQLAEKKEYYRLSSAQKRLYVLQQIELDSTAYNVPQVVVIEGKSDRDRMAATFKKLIHRHESFRTSFHIVEEEPVQRVHEFDDVVFEIEYDQSLVNCQGRGEVPSPIKVEKIIDNFIRPFDLSKVPLLRVGLIKTEEKNHIIMMDMHHIITDGTSMNLFINEFMALYAGEELLPLKFHYKDYAQWQNSEDQQKSIKQQERYWLKQFEGEIPVLGLPIDFPRPRVQSFEGSSESFELSSHQTRQLKNLAQEQEVTLFMSLLAVMTILLSKFCNQEDIVVGTPIAARRHVDLERIIGMFVNTLAMRNYPGGKKTFREFLHQVKKRTLEAFENQEYQFEDLVEKVSVNRDASRNPLFDVLLVLQNMEAQTGESPIVDKPQLNIKPYKTGTKISKFDITMTCFEGENRLVFNLQYCTKLFKKETIERFITYFKKIVSSVIHNPVVKLWQIEVISGEEKRKLLYDFNDTKVEYPVEKTIHQLFAEQVERTPDNISVTGVGGPEAGTQHLTYKELDEKSHQLAYLLRTRGVKPNSITAMMMKRSMKMMIAILGILKAGGAYLPIEPGYPPERLDYMLADSGTKILVTTRGLSEKITFEKNIVYFDDYKELPPNTQYQLTSLQQPAASLAYVIYTSGSTGKPKGVLVEHASVVNLVFTQMRQFKIDADDRILQFSSVCFDASVEQIFIALFSGAVLALIDENTLLDNSKFRSFISNRKITHIHAVPSFLNNIELKEKQRYHLRRIISGGDVCPVSLANKLSRYCDFYNEYGPTETTVTSIEIMMGYEEADESLHRLPIGRPIDNTTVYILDNWMNAVAVGVVGELYIGGAGVARGYLNRPELTDDKFLIININDKLKTEKEPRGQPMHPCNHASMQYKSPIYRTGDLARWLPDSNIEYLGRIDHQVKIRGYRIELGEIEHRLLKHEGIKEVVVVSKNNEINDQYLCSYIVADRESEPAGTELTEFLSKTLPGYMIPAYFVFLEHIPLTPTGKIDRRKLPEPGISTGTGLYITPQDAVEKELVRIWAEILALEKNKISVNANFFQLGGHSLKAMVMISKIHKKLHVRLPLAEIFKTPDIRGLSRYIKGLAKDKYTWLEPVEKKEYYVLSSAQQRLYILNRMEPESTAYNMPAVFPLLEQADIKKLERTFLQLIKRYESLRTSFLMIEGEPVQRVHEFADVEFEIEYYDLPTEDTEGKAHHSSKNRIIHHSFIRPFDLSRAPLLRVGLLEVKEVKESNYVLLVDMNHIISDGISSGILITEFLTIYRKQQLSKLRIQYKDFTGWQHRTEIVEAIKRQKNYWLKEFEGEIPVLDLPTDYARPTVQSFAGSHLYFELSAPQTRALESAATGEGASLYMVLLALMNILFSKLSGQEDIVIGSPTAGRRHADLEKIIGMFVNTLVLRNYPRGEKTFKEFVKEVKISTLNAFENQEYPFEELVEILDIKRDVSRNPLFDVMFIMQTFTGEAPGSEGFAEDPPAVDQNQYSFENETSKFDLTVTAVKDREKISFTFQYCTKLFKKESIERFITYFKKIVSSVIQNPGAKLWQIEVISGEEKRKILYDFNDTKAEYPGEKTIRQSFAEQAARSPDNIAVVGHDKETTELASSSALMSITYKELNRKSNQLAYVLHQKSVGPDIIVGIMMQRSIEMIIGIFGILKAGGAYLPIDPGYPQERINYILADSKADILITNSNIFNDLEIRQELFVLNFEHLNFGFVSNFDIRISDLNASNLAYVIYTSGSTGKPKGVLIQHGSLANVLSYLFDSYPFSREDTYLFKTPYVFDVSLTELFGWFPGGGRLAVLEHGAEKDPQLIIDTIKDHQVSHINFVPSMFNVFVESFNQETIDQLTSLRYIFLAGEALSPFIVKRFTGFAGKIVLENIYGPTEATIYASKYSLSCWSGEGLIPIGQPVQNTTLYILNRFGHLQPLGVVGELCISGEGLARGYLNNPELTVEKFQMPDKPGYYRSYILYRTGDLARWLPDGNIEFLGRIDHQVKIRGNRIELGEIENHLLQHEVVKEAVVVVRVDQTGDNYLCAYTVFNSVTLNTNEDISSGLRKYLSQSLPDYMIPSFFVNIERLPLTPSGKIDRSALPMPEVEVGEKYTAPRDEVEKTLAAIWSEVLEIKKEVIGIDMNFFKSGGHSLRATVMAARLHRKLNVRLPLAQVFKTPTIRGLSQYITGTAKDIYTAIKPTEKKEYYLLSSAQKRIYIIQQMEPGSTGYNLPQIIPLEVEVEKVRMENTFRKLIQRHESLRTSFLLIHGQPVQKVHDQCQFEIKYDNHSNEGTGTSVDLTINHLTQPFDLSNAPLLRIGLIKTGTNEHLLIVNMHHIISDAVSLEILRWDFMSLFADKALEELRIQYKDYSQWHDQFRQSDKMKKQEEYWLNQYSGQIPLLNLPNDYPRPEVLGQEGDRITFTIDKTETTLLGQIAAEIRCTMYMVLLALFNILLSRISGREDIVIGTPVANRGHPDTEKIIGMFVNTLAVRNYPVREKTFETFLLEVKEKSLAAFENQDYPFEELVYKLMLKRDPSRNPLFDVMLTMRIPGEQAPPPREKENEDSQSYKPLRFGSEFDLLLSGRIEDETLVLNLTYSTSLFKRETAEVFIRYLKEIISIVVKNKNIKIGDIKISHRLFKNELNTPTEEGDFLF